MRASTIVAVALSALCLVAMVSAAAKPAQLNIKQQIALRAIQQQNNTDTISGIIDGISYVAGMPHICSKSHNDVSNNFIEGTRAFQRAFAEAPNPLDFENGLRLYGAAIASLGDSLQYCGLNTIVSNWTKVAHQIGSQPGRGVTNLMNSMAQRINSLNLNVLIQQINNDFDNGLDYAAGVKIGQIVGTILTPNVPDLTFLAFLTQLTRLLPHLIRH